MSTNWMNEGRGAFGDRRLLDGWPQCGFLVVRCFRLGSGLVVIAWLKIDIEFSFNYLKHD